MKRLGLGGVALCLKTPGCLALTGATGLEFSRFANLAMEKNLGISEDGAYAIAVTNYLEERVRGRPTSAPPVPNHTGNVKPVNPTSGIHRRHIQRRGRKRAGLWVANHWILRILRIIFFRAVLQILCRILSRFSMRGQMGEARFQVGVRQLEHWIMLPPLSILGSKGNTSRVTTTSYLVEVP